MAMLSRLMGGGLPRMMSADAITPVPPVDPGVLGGGGGGGGGVRTPAPPPQMQAPPMQAASGMGFGAPNPQFMQAFSQNPQFQQQLSALMRGQSPGFGPVQFNPFARG